MQISKAANKFNLTVETLHYWELSGVIPPVNRDASGNRDYDKEDLGWIAFAKCMRSAGVSIKCLKEYIQLFKQGHSTKVKRKQLLQNQLDIINDKIKHLSDCRDLLHWKVNHYDLVDASYHGKLFNCIDAVKKGNKHG